MSDITRMALRPFGRNTLKALNLAGIALLLLVVYIPASRADIIAPGQGVSFSQVDFTHSGATSLDSNYGMIAADYSALFGATGISTGYLNVSTGQGWVTQNMPVDLSSGLAGLSSYFDLGSTGNVSSLNALVDFSSTPTPLFGGLPSHTFPVGTVEDNAEGLGGPVTAIGPPPSAGGISFQLGGLIDLTWQPGHVTLEEDAEQCGPGSVARSLTYLKNRYGLPVPHANNKGTGTENTPNSPAIPTSRKSSRWRPNRS